MTSDELARKAAARFFLGVARAEGPWRDEHTMPLFPLLLVVNEEMMDADARHEAGR